MGSPLRTPWVLLIAAVLLGWPLGAQAAVEQQQIAEEEATPEPVLTKAPELVEFVNAAYPPELLAQGVGGEVSMLIDIDAKGIVERVEVTETSHPAFAQPAMVAATRFKFSPAEVDYEPSPIRIQYVYRFTAQEVQPDIIAGLPIERDAAATEVNFAGTVYEAGVREPVAGAVISIDGTPVSETDRDGKFEVRGVAPGRHAITVKSPYHAVLTGEEEIGYDERLEVAYYVRRDSYDPYETVVRTKLERKEVSRVILERAEVKKLPGTSGDPIKAIENLPGMARVPGGFGGALLVRGANPADTKVYMDGVEIPILYHFGGLVSVVNPNMLERIDFYPGGFSARYGGAIAGVVDVVTRDADCEGFHGELEPSLAVLQGFACLHRDDEWTLSMAARRSVVDAYIRGIFDALPREEGQGLAVAVPVFADYQFKAQGNFGNHRLDIFFFGSDDTLSLVQSGSTESINFSINTHQAFHRALVRHRWQITPDLRLTTTVSPGYTVTEFGGESEDLGAEANLSVEVFGVSVREDMDLTISDTLRVRAGFEGNFGVSRLSINAPFPTQLREFPNPFFDVTVSSRFTQDFEVYNHSYWVEGIWEPGWGFKLIPGLRFDRWDFYKTEKISVLPRLNARWEFLEGMTLKAAYGMFERLPDPQDILDRPLGNPELDPLRAHHFILGYEHVFTDLINVDLQVYHIRRERLPATDLSSVVQNGQAVSAGLINSGGADTVGLELMVRHLATRPTADSDGSFLDLLRGHFHGWIAYTLSQTLRYDRGPNATYTQQTGAGPILTFDYPERATRPYPSPFDQTHILTVVAQATNLPWGLEAGIRFRLVSGNPFTPQDAGTIYVDIDDDSYGVDLTLVPRNSGRMPLFHQLDVRVDKTWTFDLWKLTAYLEIYNVYGQQNVEQIQYAYDRSATAGLSLLPFLPVLGVQGSW